MPRTLALAAPFAALIATTAIAQDVGPALDMTGMIGYAGISSYNQQLRAQMGRGGGARSPSPAPSVSTRAFSVPARSAIAPDKSYPTPSAQFRQQQVAAYLERASRTDPQGASALRAQFARYDYARIYDGVTRPYGLAGNDAASSLAAYMALGWIIVHGGQEPSAAGLRGIRAQAAQALSDPRLSQQGMRAKLGEEFKILFVTVHAGWQAARREGTLDRYADGVATLFETQNGMALRAVRIGPGGFQRE